MSNKRQLNSHSDLQNSTKRRVNKSNQNDTMSPASRGRGKWGRQGSSSSSDEASAKEVFDQIADPDDNSCASMEGISKLCEHLDIDPVEDVKILVLLHKMGSNSKPAQISREEWMSGCQKLGLGDINSFKALLPSLELGFMERADFRDFFKFCFKFNLEGTHKTLDKDLVVDLVDITLKERIAGDRLTNFKEFLNTTKDVSYDRITLDQWISFLDFSIDCPDLSLYDEDNSAWPVLIDDYVDFSNGMKM